MNENDSRGMPEKALTFDAILDDAWGMLVQGSESGDSPLHTAALGTVSANRSRVRTVILRRADPVKRIVACYTDARSRKVSELRRHPRATYLFYDPRERLQLRLAGTATIHTGDETADSAWAELTPLGRRLYCGQAPGSRVDRPSPGVPEELLRREPTTAETDIGRAHFSVIVCGVDYLEWLDLKFAGHRRAIFTWRDGVMEAVWLIP
jgi:hypothetical protein